MFYCLDRFVEQYGLHGPFLEVGCGRGDVSAYLAAKGWQGPRSTSRRPPSRRRGQPRAVPAGDGKAAGAGGRHWRLRLHHHVGRAGAHGRRSRRAAHGRALAASRRATPARRAQQSARVALGRRLLRAFPPLHGGGHDGAAAGGGLGAFGLLGFHVSVVLADAPDVHAVEVRRGRGGRQGNVDEGERDGKCLGRGPFCRSCSNAPRFSGTRCTGCSSGCSAMPPALGHEFFVLARKAG